LCWCFFWTKLGTATERAESGTVEEIKEAVAAARKSWCISLIVPLNLSSIDPRQLKRLNKYKDEFRTMGIYGTFNSINDF